MSRETVQDMYFAKVSRFGNGAKLKAYKSHYSKEMVIMTKDKYLELLKKKVEAEGYKPISEKDARRTELELAKKQEG